MILVDLRGHLSNPEVQIALERLARLLSDLEDVPPVANKPLPALKPAHKLVQRLPPVEIRELVAAYEAGASSLVLAERFKLGKASVLSLLHQQGVARRQQRRLSESELQEAARLYRAGWSTAKIGRQLGVGDETIRQRLRKTGITMRGCHERRSPRDAIC